MKFLILIVALLFTMGCRTDLTGQLNLAQNLVIKHEVKEQFGDNETWRTETSIIKPGKYDARISFSGCCDLTLTLNPKSFRRQTYQMTLPKNAGLPKHDGNFYLRGHEINQSFDLAGDIKSETKNTEVVKRYETCQFQDLETICDSSGCYTYTVWRTGWQWLEYYNQITTVTMNAEFKIPKQNQTLGYFNGSDSFVEKVVLYEGPCR